VAVRGGNKAVGCGARGMAGLVGVAFFTLGVMTGFSTAGRAVAPQSVRESQLLSRSNSSFRLRPRAPLPDYSAVLVEWGVAREFTVTLARAWRSGDFSRRHA